ECIRAARAGERRRARDGYARPEGRIRAIVPGAGAHLRILFKPVWAAMPAVPAQLCGGPALRRAGGYRAAGLCGPARGAWSSGVQRNLAARREFVCAAVAGVLRSAAQGTEYYRT